MGSHWGAEAGTREVKGTVTRDFTRFSHFRAASCQISGAGESGRFFCFTSKLSPRLIVMSSSCSRSSWLKASAGAARTGPTHPAQMS